MARRWYNRAARNQRIRDAAALAEQGVLDPAQAQEHIASWLRDPVLFARQCWGKDPWAKQAEVLHACRKYRRVTVRSCNGAGKSCVAAMAVLDFLYSHPGSLVITTAPGARQVEGIVWREIREMWEPKATLMGGEMPPKAAELRLNGIQWRAVGFTTKAPGQFMGYHHPWMLVVVDEASEVEEEVFAAIWRLMSGQNSKLLLIGNPLRCRGVFFDSHQPDRKWSERNNEGFFQLHISAFETPNVRAGKEVIPGLASPEWVATMKADYGEESPEYKACVLGEFPIEDDWTLVPLDWVHKAMSLDNAPGPDEAKGELIMGVDVSRFGDDRTIACIRNDREIVALKRMERPGNLGLMEVADWIIQIGDAHNIPGPHWIIDGGGLGGGLVDRLRQLGKNVGQADFGMSAQDQNAFLNRRAEMYWRLRMRLCPTVQENPFYIPSFCTGLKAQLPSIKYKTVEGRRRVDSKETLRAILKRSPDESDALAMTFAVSKQPDIRIWTV